MKRTQDKSRYALLGIMTLLLSGFMSNPCLAWPLPPTDPYSQLPTSGYLWVHVYVADQNHAPVYSEPVTIAVSGPINLGPIRGMTPPPPPPPQGAFGLGPAVNFGGWEGASFSWSMDVKPGEYTITVTVRGEIQTKTVAVPVGGSGGVSFQYYVNQGGS
jgi:hypothetical protein